MSMFHELMMRKKEEIMYATIKGTLTENDGVFSGFSGTNYLALQHIIDFSKPFEILLKFTPTDFTNPLYLFSTRYNTNSGLDIYIQNSKIRIWGSTNGTSLDISSYSIDTININTTYWYKLKYSPTQIIAELSTDGINFVQENNIALSNQIYQNNYNALIGHGQTANTNYFVGSIDLNNSYIKIGSTKYNLQAVVGWTKVGSPTITDGVVSGFSSSDYVHITNFPNTFNSIEFITKAKKETSGNRAIFSLNNGSISQYKFYLYMTDAKVDFAYYSAIDDSTKHLVINSTFENNVYYFFKVKISNSKIILNYSTDGINWIENEVTDTIRIASGFDLRYGVVTNNGWILNGSIDMNETLIKKDNKLWFNGQEG